MLSKDHIDGLEQCSSRDVALLENPQNSPFADSKNGATLLNALSGFIKPDDIVFIANKFFCGHVFNLQTEDGWYVANGIVTHNCEEANGQVVDFNTAQGMIADEHPNGTRDIVPVFGGA